MGDRRHNDTPAADEQPMKHKLEKTMDQAEGELETVEEDLEQKEQEEPRHQRG